MGNLDDKSFIELVVLAKNFQLVDGWKQREETVVLQVGNRSVEIHQAFARAFVMGLLRGYERATELGLDGGERNE